MRTALAGMASLLVLAGLAGLMSLRSVDGKRAASSTPIRCVPPRLNISAALADSRLTVSPAPDSRDSSATTQISLLGAPASALANVKVEGSRTGAHAGRLAAYSQGNGASFLPARPFAGGEHVSVHGELRDGARSIPFAWNFTVAVRDTAGSAGGSAHPPPSPRDYQSFRSRPDLKPPDVTVSAHSPDATPGDLFLAPYSGPGQYGPMILDESGALVWFKPLPRGTRAADFRVQQYEGKPVLTWWQDPLISGGSSKSGLVIADSSYREFKVIRAGNGYQPDLHEFQITPRGTALITVYDGIDCDLRSVGGARDAAVADTLLQEIDLKTGLVMYEWHSLDHVPLSGSYASPAHSSQTTPFDYFHINSIDVQKNGDLLIDARNTWAAYDVDARTGKVRWQLGGKHATFKMGAGTRTAWQHDARQQQDGTITFFDNGATPAVHPESRAIALRLDASAKTATLVRHDEHPGHALVAGSQGNVQMLANGNWLVGWGQVPYVSEFSPSGKLLFDAQLPSKYESYRAYRLPWVGQPSSAPVVASVRATGAHAGTVLYASWNGATEVASWRVLAGSSPASLAPVSTAPKTGFETAIKLSAATAAPYVAVQALDSAGAVIGVSTAAKTA